MFNDVWCLDVERWAWVQLPSTTAPPPARYVPPPPCLLWWAVLAEPPCVGVSIAALWELSDCRLCFEAGESACGTHVIERQPCCRGACCKFRL